MISCQMCSPDTYTLWTPILSDTYTLCQLKLLLQLRHQGKYICGKLLVVLVERPVLVGLVFD